MLLATTTAVLRELGVNGYTFIVSEPFSGMRV